MGSNRYLSTSVNQRSQRLWDVVVNIYSDLRICRTLWGCKGTRVPEGVVTFDLRMWKFNSYRVEIENGSCKDTSLSTAK
uniref:Candidate secreted effector n=1 Tax=Meloidogyne incognita TaxID=6306 RepID=A0A914NHR7_MELIC